jgi:hypothetical protein
MPLPRVPQRGDAARLQQLASGLKKEHGTYGAVVQRNPVGRPPGEASATQAAPQAPALRQEHKTVFDELAQAEMTRQQWRSVAQQSPTPWVQAMLDIAERNYQAAAARAYNIIPNTEY